MIFIQLFMVFLKIGLFTFGGGYAMLPLIQAEAIKNHWIDAESLVNFIAVSESTPGPFAVNIATYIGRQIGGIGGAVCATLGVAVPSFIIILIIAHCYDGFKNSSIVSGCMNGLRPAVIGLIAAAVVSVAKTAFFGSGIKLDGSTIYLLGIFLLTAYLAFKKNVHPILIIIISAASGTAVGYLVCP